MQRLCHQDIITNNMSDRVNSFNVLTLQYGRILVNCNKQTEAICYRYHII